MNKLIEGKTYNFMDCGTISKGEYVVSIGKYHVFKIYFDPPTACSIPSELPKIVMDSNVLMGKEAELYCLLNETGVTKVYDAISAILDWHERNKSE